MVFSKGVLPPVSRCLDARADLSGTFYENFEMTLLSARTPRSALAVILSACRACSATREQTIRIFHHDRFEHLRQQTCAAIAKKQASDMLVE
jgi:hypothetical protein